MRLSPQPPKGGGRPALTYSLKVVPQMWADHRFGVLQAELGLSQPEAVGVLVLFWLATRQAGQPAMPPAALDACLPCGQDNRSAFRQALLRAQYIAVGHDGDFEVCDNIAYFSTHQKRVEAGRKGGQARVRKPGRAAKAKAEPSSRVHNLAAWEAYRQAYMSKWSVEPVPNAKNRAHVSTIVQRVGADHAPRLLAFFVQHTDRLYVAKQHDLGLAVRDCHGLLTQMKRGRAITSSDMREFEGQQRLLSQMERLEAGW